LFTRLAAAVEVIIHLAGLAVRLVSVEMEQVTLQMPLQDKQAPDLAAEVVATSLLLGLWEVVGLTV
jgi:hypothetical protein